LAPDFPFSELFFPKITPNLRPEPQNSLVSALENPKIGQNRSIPTENGANLTENGANSTENGENCTENGENSSKTAQNGSKSPQNASKTAKIGGIGEICANDTAICHQLCRNFGKRVNVVEWFSQFCEKIREIGEKMPNFAEICAISAENDAKMAENGKKTPKKRRRSAKMAENGPKMAEKGPKMPDFLGNPVLQARFSRAVAELAILGFVKESGT
jgi:hypothetical protein